MNYIRPCLNPTCNYLLLVCRNGKQIFQLFTRQLEITSTLFVIVKIPRQKVLKNWKLPSKQNYQRNRNMIQQLLDKLRDKSESSSAYKFNKI